jgi:hypothetical protein
MAVLECEHLRHLLVHAGLSHLLWGGLRLAVVRLLLPNAPVLFPASPALMDDLVEGETPLQSELPSTDLWAAAQAFWHVV